MITQEIINELSEKALKVALAKSSYHEHDFSYIMIDDKEIIVVFTIGMIYSGEEYHVTVDVADFDKDLDVMRKEYEAEIAEKELAKALKLEKEQQRIKEEKEKADYQRYIALKEKFEKD